MHPANKGLSQLKATSLALLLLPFLLIGCASHPPISATHPREAKVVVEEDGSVWVNGAPINITDFADIIRAADTKPTDMIFVLFKADPESPRMRTIQQILTSQFIQAQHVKFFFLSELQATVITTDKRTGKKETQVAEQEIRVLKGEEIEAEVRRMEADKKAYEEGSYVSPAAVQRAQKISEEKVASPIVTPLQEDKEAEMRRAYERRIRRQQLNIRN